LSALTSQLLMVDKSESTGILALSKAGNLVEAKVEDKSEMRLSLIMQTRIDQWLGHSKD